MKCANQLDDRIRIAENLNCSTYVVILSNPRSQQLVLSLRQNCVGIVDITALLRLEIPSQKGYCLCRYDPRLKLCYPTSMCSCHNIILLSIGTN